MKSFEAQHGVAVWGFSHDQVAPGVLLVFERAGFLGVAQHEGEGEVASVEEVPPGEADGFAPRGVAGRGGHQHQQAGALATRRAQLR